MGYLDCGKLRSSANEDLLIIELNWMCLECELNVTWMFPECTWKRLECECATNVPET